MTDHSKVFGQKVMAVHDEAINISCNFCIKQFLTFGLAMNHMQACHSFNIRQITGLLVHSLYLLLKTLEVMWQIIGRTLKLCNVRVFKFTTYCNVLNHLRASHSVII